MHANAMAKVVVIQFLTQLFLFVVTGAAAGFPCFLYKFVGIHLSLLFKKVLVALLQHNV